MNARVFLSLMFLISVIATGWLIYAGPVQKANQKKECPSSSSVNADDAQLQTADMMIWESVSRHLLSSLR